MNVTAPFSRFLARLSAAQAGWQQGSVDQVVPAIVPVAVVAHDESDESRNTFWAATSLPAVGGQAGRLIVIPALGGGPIELLWAGASGGNVPINFEWSMGWWETLTGTQPTGPTQASNVTGPQSTPRGYVESSYGILAGADWIEAIADLTAFLPVQGTILEPGYGIRLQGPLGGAFRAHIGWRNL